MAILENTPVQNATPLDKVKTHESSGRLMKHCRLAFSVYRYMDLGQHSLENSGPNQVWRLSFQSCEQGAWQERPHDPEDFLSCCFQSLGYFRWQCIPRVEENLMAIVSSGFIAQVHNLQCKLSELSQ